VIILKDKERRFMDAEKYPLSSEFLRRLLSLVIVDQGFGLRVVEALDPSLIGYSAYSMIFLLLQSYALGEGLLPSHSTFRQLALQRYHSGAVKEQVYTKALANYRRAIKTRPVSRKDAKIVLTQALLDTEILAALDESYKLYKDKEYEQVFLRMENAQERTRILDVGSIGFNMRKSLDKYIDEIASGKAKVDRLPTGVYPLDVGLKGGLGRGELGAILGAEKDGKSMALNHIAASCVLAGLQVVYVSAELGELELKNRFTANILNMTLDRLESGGEDTAWLVGEKLAKVFSVTGGDITHKAFPPKTVTVRDIAAYLRDLKRFMDVDPDVLIVDYADELKTPKHRQSDSSSTYHDMGSIYSELRALGAPLDAGGFNCAVWTASQVQRAAIGKEVIEFRDVADSILKAAKVDLMVGLCRNAEEREADVLRLIVSVCRYAPFPQEVGPFARAYEHGRLVRFDSSVSRFGDLEWRQRTSQQRRSAEKPLARIKTETLRKLCQRSRQHQCLAPPPPSLLGKSFVGGRSTSLSVKQSVSLATQ